MASYKYLIIIVASFVVYCLILWLLGLWSRRSILAKILSCVVIFMSVVILVKLFFVRYNLGTVTVALNKGVVIEINKIDLSADLDIKKYKQKNNYIIIEDAKGHKYAAKVPSKVTTSSFPTALIPADSFIFSRTYLVVKVYGIYIVATWGKLGSFFSSIFAVFMVWLAGKEGKLAYMAPSFDD